jgi:hypothetical protein
MKPADLDRFDSGTAQYGEVIGHHERATFYLIEGQVFCRSERGVEFEGTWDEFRRAVNAGNYEEVTVPSPSNHPAREFFG